MTKNEFKALALWIVMDRLTSEDVKQYKSWEDVTNKLLNDNQELNLDNLDNRVNVIERLLRDIKSLKNKDKR